MISILTLLRLFCKRWKISSNLQLLFLDKVVLLGIGEEFVVLGTEVTLYEEVVVRLTFISIGDSVVELVNIVVEFVDSVVVSVESVDIVDSVTVVRFVVIVMVEFSSFILQDFLAVKKILFPFISWPNSDFK